MSEFVEIYSIMGWIEEVGQPEVFWCWQHRHDGGEFGGAVGDAGGDDYPDKATCLVDALAYARAHKLVVRNDEDN